MKLFRTLRLTAVTAVLLAAVGTPAALATPQVTLTVAPSRLIAGATATYTIAISPQPTGGTVTIILDGGQAICTTPAALAAVTTCTAPAPANPGRHIFWASYSSGGLISTPEWITVESATTTKVSAAPKLADPGQTMQYVATVSPRVQNVEITSTEDPQAQACSPGCGNDPAPETADFSVDGVALEACADRPVDLETGIATCSATAPAAGGKHVVTASYSGTDVLKPSEGQDDFAVKAAAVTLSASAADFGAVTVGASSTRSITITNSGTRDLHLGATTVGGPFTITSDGCAGATLVPGATCVITLAFTPSTAGAAAATLTITGDAGSHTVALTGTGTTIPTVITQPPTGAKFAPNESTTLSVSKSDAGSSSVTVPVRCPTGVACTLDGTVVIATSDLAKAAHSSATQVQTVARFSGVRVAAGKVREIKLKLSPAFIKSAQRRGVRLIRATLTIHTKFTDGTQATSKQRVKIRIPKAVVKKAAKRALAPKFTG